MNLLLDTHVFLWWRGSPRRIAAKARRAIERADVVHVSAASAWESVIKSMLGKLRLPGPLQPAVEDSDFVTLDINFAHAEALRRLPMHHPDPFDRMLIAQAHVESLTIVTADEQFAPYDIPLIWT